MITGNLPDSSVFGLKEVNGRCVSLELSVIVLHSHTYVYVYLEFIFVFISTNLISCSYIYDEVVVVAGT